jgi:hypothetical protein
MSTTLCKSCDAALDGRNRKAYCAACRPRKQQRRSIEWKPMLAADGPAATFVEETTELQDGVPPSGRDGHYFLVEQSKREGFFYPNDLSAYNGFCRRTAALRDELRFPPMDDATRHISYRWRAESVEEIIALLSSSVGLRDLTVGQPFQHWIAVEKRGLQPRMKRALNEPFGIPVIPLGGFASQPLRAEVRRRVEEDGRPAHLYYAADFDPSGWFIGDNFAAKTRIPWASVTRVALTLDQVTAYDIPPNPAPSKDPRLERFIAETGTDIQVEVNALEVVRPGLLAELFWEAIEPYWNHEVHAEAVERERKLRDSTVEAIRTALSGER